MPAPQLRTVTAQPGDLYLLCTDGLTGHLADDDLHDIVSGSGEPEAIAEALVEAANERGGSDNITVALVRIASTPSAG
jgi:protein phosphatase